jgi:hypothetical protein
MVKTEDKKAVAHPTVVAAPEVKKPKLEYKIETGSGVYTIKRPSGKAGALHFSMLAKTIPTARDEDGNPVLSPADQERFATVFQDWSEKILPMLWVDGPCKYDEMPGEDQYAIFLAMFSVMNMGGSGELFRIVE